MKLFLLASLLFLCSCTSTISKQFTPPLASQIWPYSQQMDAIGNQSDTLAVIYLQVRKKIDPENLQRLLILDSIRYYYYRSAEFLIGTGYFTEADVYIDQLHKILDAMYSIIKIEQEKQST